MTMHAEAGLMRGETTWLAQATIDRFKPKIFLEIAPHWMKLKGYDYTRIYDLLKAGGYRFVHFDEGAGIEADIRQWSGRDTEEWDVLCLPPELGNHQESWPHRASEGGLIHEQTSTCEC